MGDHHHAALVIIMINHHSSAAPPFAAAPFAAASPLASATPPSPLARPLASALGAHPRTPLHLTDLTRKSGGEEKMAVVHVGKHGECQKT